ncbi:IMPACT family protein [Xanthomonadaceae bacterium JHOS43]|nr:IMPACT family protein [Xanthomonadaceae bacterium JHOS43]MCX7563866.1 IMPACT family protein [Xanthomonadaceae bacterium XH05]
MSTTTTLAAPARLEIDVKKSRFLAQAAPVASPEEALAFLSNVSDPSATHNCWAYRIGQGYRFSDDGEPASTAGKPILAAIDGQGIDGVMVVVTRWFGGIKLGAGGLVRAYGGTAAECLRQAERRVVVPHLTAHLTCAFEHAGSAYSALHQHGAEKTGERYAPEGLTLTLRLPAANLDALANTLRDATRGQARLVVD